FWGPSRFIVSVGLLVATNRIFALVTVPFDVGLYVGRRHQLHRVAERFELPRPMVRRGTGLDAHQARWQLLEERWHIAPFQLTADDPLASGINTIYLKIRLGDVETDCRNCLHVWLLSIVGALTAPTFMALARRWRSRPQHQKRTLTRAVGLSAMGQ